MSDQLMLLTKFNDENMAVGWKEIRKSKEILLYPHLVSYNPSEINWVDTSKIAVFNNWAEAYLCQQWLKVADTHERRKQLLPLDRKNGEYQNLVIAPIPKVNKDDTKSFTIPLSMEMGVLLARMKNPYPLLLENHLK